MILRSAEEFLKQSFGDDQRGSLTADRFLLVRPDEFEVPDCPDNVFAHGAETVIQSRAKYQHRRIQALLESVGKQVKVFGGKYADDVFPNNVFATNKSGEMMIGNMFHEVRKPEMERSEILNWFLSEGFRVLRLADYTQQTGELTGSLIIDH